MFVTINDNELNVEVLGEPGSPVLIAHHGGGGLRHRTVYRRHFTLHAGGSLRDRSLRLRPIG